MGDCSAEPEKRRRSTKEAPIDRFPRACQVNPCRFAALRASQHVYPGQDPISYSSSRWGQAPEHLRDQTAQVRALYIEPAEEARDTPAPPVRRRTPDGVSTGLKIDLSRVSLATQRRR